MRRMLLIGWILGALTFGGGAFAASNWYEYRIAVANGQALSLINGDGWERVPNQADPLYVRRPRFGFH